ncbi:MAG: helix-hairpin-helix domain-containing protein [Gammaproteobacteria bacterium]|nr:helix-hairpin-helix domain-containing protein [Gammaproteobacteria bacterium]
MRLTLLSLLFFSFFLVSSLVSAAPVNINTADAGHLETSLVGIGSEKAAAIVQYREDNGSFASVDDLANVKGIGQKTIDKNRENLTVTE